LHRDGSRTRLAGLSTRYARFTGLRYGKIRGGRMKEIKSYQCELCGGKFKTAEKAQKCEREHKKNLRVIGKTYSVSEVCGFPKFITVASEDPSFSAVYSYERLTNESF
jgi:hypothetical protein